MTSFNDQKTMIFAAIFTSLITIYSVVFDISDLHIVPTTFYIAQKTFFIILPCVWIYFFRSIKLDNKVFIYGLIWSFYSIFHTYYYSINYMIASIQVTLFYTSLLFITRLRFIIMFTFLTVGTAFAIVYSPSIHGFGSLNHEMRMMYLDDFLTIQLMTVVVYFVTSYPRVKKLKEDLKFSNFGKASSFIIHEMQKPLNRLSIKDKDNLDLEALKRTLEIAKKLQKGSVDSAKIMDVSLVEIHQRLLEKYQDFLDFYSIKIQTDFQNSVVNTDQEITEMVLDNLIRNAIEANKENELGKRWIKIIAKNSSVTISNPYFDMISEKELFTPLKSSKVGNMGVGLHFCKTILEGLNHDIKIKCKNNLFEVQLDF